MTNTDTDNKYLTIIAKLLSYLCLNTDELKNASVTEKAKFLNNVGFTDKDVALLLNTSENSLRVLRSLNKKTKQSKSKAKNNLEEIK